MNTSEVTHSGHRAVPEYTGKAEHSLTHLVKPLLRSEAAGGFVTPQPPNVPVPLKVTPQEKGDGVWWHRDTRPARI